MDKEMSIEEAKKELGIIKVAVKKILGKNIEENTENLYIIDGRQYLAIETILKALNNSISKDKVKEKIKILEDLQNEHKNSEELRIKIITLKELLKEGE